MVSKATIKLIKSLQQKKYRNKTGMFTVEGVKSVKEFLAGSFVCRYLLYESEVSSEFAVGTQVTKKELEQMSGLKSSQKVIGVFEQNFKEVLPSTKGLLLGIDGVQDPGNLGTIIRIADWFGIKNILCSPTTVDCFNPKTIQSSMGSLNRVNVFYTQLTTFLQFYPHPVYGTFLEGKNVYKQEFPNHAMLIMGNEGKGISPTVKAMCTHEITIPQSVVSAESLNVAMATAILASEFRRGSLAKL